MEMRLKYVTKEQAHKMIDEVEGDTIFVLSYNKDKGISNNEKHISARKINLIFLSNLFLYLFINFNL